MDRSLIDKWVYNQLTFEEDGVIDMDQDPVEEKLEKFDVDAYYKKTGN